MNPNAREQAIFAQAETIRKGAAQQREGIGLGTAAGSELLAVLRSILGASSVSGPMVMVTIVLRRGSAGAGADQDHQQGENHQKVQVLFSFQAPFVLGANVL